MVMGKTADGSLRRADAISTAQAKLGDSFFEILATSFYVLRYFLFRRTQQVVGIQHTGAGA